jgi:hypothetical protein
MLGGVGQNVEKLEANEFAILNEGKMGFFPA